MVLKSHAYYKEKWQNAKLRQNQIARVEMPELERDTNFTRREPKMKKLFKEFDKLDKEIARLVDLMEKARAYSYKHDPGFIMSGKVEASIIKPKKTPVRKKTVKPYTGKLSFWT